MKLTKPLFRKWLAKKDPQSIVGIPGAGRSCPIATYLKEHGADMVWVDGYNILFNDNGEWHDAPTKKWASNFIVRVDGTFLPKTKITATEALGILDSI